VEAGFRQQTLVETLNEMTHRCVLRADEAVPAALADRVEANDLFYELRL
jgi:hypothetical protein